MNSRKQNRSFSRFVLTSLSAVALLALLVTPSLAGDGRGPHPGLPHFKCEKGKDHSCRLCRPERGNPNPGVFPIQSRPFGKSYGEWGGEWWNWALQFPYLSDPITDDTGEDGDQGQHGPVWFLAGTFGNSVERTVTIPRGKALFFPLFNALWFFPFDVPTEEEARQLANDQVEAVTGLECIVDGRPLRHLFNYRAESPPGGYTQVLPPDSVLTDPDIFLDLFGIDFAYPAGETGAVTDGYWLMLAPLRPGCHTIQFGSTADFGSGPFNVEVTYHITVK